MLSSDSSSSQPPVDFLFIFTQLYPYSQIDSIPSDGLPWFCNIPGYLQIALELYILEIFLFDSLKE